MVLSLFLALLQQPQQPVDFGKRELAAVAGPRMKDIQISVVPGREKECYAITPVGNSIKIVGSDPVGAMYGAYEFAERLRNDPEKAWKTKAEGEPFLQDRGLNLFLTLPWDYKKNDTDYDPAALIDPERWWFQNEDYWTTLLDLMAKSRLNWLDIHGSWDISVTSAPNLYAYFVTSKNFPLVGVSDAIKAANLKQLNHVIEMAHARGIRVSLMAYEANLKIPQNPNPPYEATEANIYRYTADVVEAMIRQAPGLDAIGYRIGESGKGESFFHCYTEAVKNSGRDIPIITRSWITRKQNVLPLARASKDFTVEIKYNGEQWGAPYMVAGGRVANWYSYSFEDYLSDSGAKGAKTWPGNEAVGGGRWPSEPYKIVWQVRANGTHRIFPFYNPDWVRRSITCMKIGTTSGYTIEGEDAYYPKSPEYYLKDPAGNPFKWTHQRDEMYWMTWGRLGYDPKTPDSTFDAGAKAFLHQEISNTDEIQADRTVRDMGMLIHRWKQDSTLISKGFMGFSLGPDHRSHAPELEWGGDTAAYIQGQGFDSHSYLPINEEFANRWTGGVDGRRSLWNLAGELSVGNSGNGDHLGARGQALSAMASMMEARSIYTGARFQSAHELAAAEAEFGSPTQSAVDYFLIAETTHSILARSLLFRPFTERLRMHTNTFTWAAEQKSVEAEAERISALPKPSHDLKFWAANQVPATTAKLTWHEDQGKIVCDLKTGNEVQAWLLVKPLPSSTFFHRVPMAKTGSMDYRASFERKPYGYAIAAEVYNPELKVAQRFPGGDEMPYEVIPAQPKPTPQIYNAEEAMRFLNPAVITPDKYSGMLLGTRAWGFFGSFNNTTKRKILDPVSRGMRLVILQQDFNKYKLDFLPKPLRIEGTAQTTFDPGGQLGLEKVETDAIMWQKFLPSDGWQVFGNGGLAMLKVGKGEVWVTSARLMQRMHIPAVARNFVKLLSLGGKAKPTILIDSCSEGADFSSSCHADLMNSHDVPFLTLGEVIAEEQGMDSFKPIAGPTNFEDVLEGKGVSLANAWIRGLVVQASKRPVPASKEAFEVERKRRKAELMRSLGLDPMPARTPLNARITGVIQRKGYRIEKLVFESRPKFYVTGHVYVPDNATGKLPVIMNVNGHWEHKKDEDRIQLRCAFQALQGYIAIAIDSPGWSFEGDALIERRPVGTHNDWALFEGGTNTTGYYVWDAMRALDYMATRPDTDMKHIGITGASGGGLATLYTFAADDRYAAAVPVVYMASMELAPDNGCLCNHVPGTSQIGDRSDVIAIQAPKPVFVMGARNDGEFPPAATLLTREKMAKEWALFGRDADTFVHVYDGPHDYNQLMREQSIGFFNKYLKGIGDGSPVPQPAIEVIDPNDHQLLALDPPAPGERTMRDLSLEYLRNAPGSSDWGVKVNGGLVVGTPKITDVPSGKRVTLTYEFPGGVRLPGVLVNPSGKASPVRIVVSDLGKAMEMTEVDPAFTTLYLDTLGVGELAGIEMRYSMYLGKSVPFINGCHLVEIARTLSKNPADVELVGRGPIASQSVMWAGLMLPFRSVTGIDGLREWADVFRDGMPAAAIQPRANLLPTLEKLKALVKNGHWR